MKTFSFQILDNEYSYLDVSKIFPPNSATVQLKQIDPITLVSNLLLYFTGTAIDAFTSQYASLYNLTMSN